MDQAAEFLAAQRLSGSPLPASRVEALATSLGLQPEVLPALMAALRPSFQAVKTYIRAEPVLRGGSSRRGDLDIRRASRPSSARDAPWPEGLLVAGAGAE